jgi:hypothetical protein
MRVKCPATLYYYVAVTRSVFSEYFTTFMFTKYFCPIAMSSGEPPSLCPQTVTKAVDLSHNNHSD